MFTLTSLTSPGRSSTIRSRIGETAWQGPHHSAQKSTSTGVSLSSTSASKLCSVTAVAIRSFLTGSLGRTQRETLRIARVVPGRKPPVREADRWRGSTGTGRFPQRPYNRFHVRAAAAISRSSRAGARRPGLVGAGADLRAAPRAESGWSEVELHRRTEDGEYDGGSRRAPPLGPYVQGRLPALQGAARLRPALPERLRLSGPVGGGEG